jgi:hypothetical protein
MKNRIFLCFTILISLSALLLSGAFILFFTETDRFFIILTAALITLVLIIISRIVSKKLTEKILKPLYEFDFEDENVFI